MNKITRTEIDEKLRLHELWLSGDRKGKQAVFKSVIISDTRFNNVRFNNVRFEDVRFYDVIFYDARFNNVRFADVSFDGVRFEDVRFDAVKFDAVSFDTVKFNDVRFYDVRFYDVCFYDVCFDGGNFDIVSFYDVCFYDVRFDAVKFDAVSLEGECTIQMCKISVSEWLYGIRWKNLSDELTLELMHHDAEFTGEKAMNEWADGGACPYNHSYRDFLFTENRKIWSPGKPKLRGLELFVALLDSQGVEHDFT